MRYLEEIVSRARGLLHWLHQEPSLESGSPTQSLTTLFLLTLHPTIHTMLIVSLSSHSLFQASELVKTWTRNFLHTPINYQHKSSHRQSQWFHSNCLQTMLIAALNLLSGIANCGTTQTIVLSTLKDNCVTIICDLTRSQWAVCRDVVAPSPIVDGGCATAKTIALLMSPSSLREQIWA